MTIKTICKRCVLDTTVADIVFDENGVCNYCSDFDRAREEMLTGSNAERQLQEIVASIKGDGRSNDYDCILGLSGGVDSSYLAYLLVQLELRPLLVHIDTGWNSEIAVKNIENIVNTLGLDLYTYVVDWQEMKELQVAFFRASVPDCDIPQDHVFPALLNRIAHKNGIKHIISGHNILTEYVLPRSWSYNSNDLVHILHINKLYGKRKLRKYPKMSLFDQFKFKYIYRIKSHRLLDLIQYDKDKAKSVIIKELGWRDYGGKHFESRFTKFFQAYYLPTKFGYDKRKAHLSNLIMSGHLTRDEAQLILSKPLYSDSDFKEDLAFVLKKLEISKDEWVDIMNLPRKKHENYHRDVDTLLFKFGKRILGRIK